MVDYVCSGDGDIAFAEFIRNLDKQDISKIRGILTRESSPIEIALPNPVINLDELPYKSDIPMHPNREDSRAI